MSDLNLSEKAWQSRVVDLAKLTGWMVMHQLHSIGTVAGWPDLVLVRSPQLIIVELKSEKGKLSLAQAQWLAELDGCGIETHVWKPSDWPTVQARLKRRAA